jgi:putative MATE family efflux protein
MRKPDTSILDTDKIGRLLFKLALPSFIGMFVVTLYNIVNTIFIGHYVGFLGIAGLSIVFPFQMLGMGFGQMMGTGGASVISRLLGQRNISKAEHTLGNAFAINLAISLVMTAVILSNPDFWLKLAGASEATLPYARDYMIVIFSGIIFNNFVMAANTLTISQGNSRIPMTSMIMGAVLNAILDAIFIIWLKMGVRGAAIGTVIAQASSTIFFLVYYLSGRSYLKIRFKNLIPDFNILKSILAIGVASLAMTLTSSVSNIVVNRSLESYGSDMAISTVGILSRLMMFALMPGMVIGQGMQPILGFNWGARNYGRILKTLKISLIAASAIGFVGFSALFFFPDVFFRIFTTDVSLINLGAHAAKRVFICMYLISFMGVSSMTFVALGKATQSFITSISRTIIFLIPAVLIFGNIWGIEGVWFSFPASDFLAFCLMLVLLIPQIKQLRKKATGSKATVPVGLGSPVEVELRE